MAATAKTASDRHPNSRRRAKTTSVAFEMDHVRDARLGPEVNNAKDHLNHQVVFELPGLDSNQDKENQNLLCYRYTTG